MPGPQSSSNVIGQWQSGTVQVRYRYRSYPAPGQRQALARVFGCARVVCNDCLRIRDGAYANGEKISDTEVQRRAITLAKATPGRAWLGEVTSVALVQACQDARRSVAVIREPDGRYYASFVVERKTAPLPSCDREIGIDLGLNALIVTSDGESIPNPRFLRKAQQRLKRAHRVCTACGMAHDRDVNAARNILAAGRADRLNACEAGVRPPLTVASGAEAGTHRSVAWAT